MAGLGRVSIIDQFLFAEQFGMGEEQGKHQRDEGGTGREKGARVGESLEDQQDDRGYRKRQHENGPGYFVGFHESAT